MPRPPNYSMERKDRERAKAAKKAEKLAAKAAAREQAAVSKQNSDESPVPTQEQDEG